MFISIFGSTFNREKLLEAARVPDKGGFTRVGRALMKHGYRQGSVFPKPVGTPTKINAHGETMLNVILNDPERRVFTTETGGIKIYSSDGKGAYYGKDGKFIGFLEWQHEKIYR